MEKEFIVQTESGSLYYIQYRHHFFEHGGRSSCTQLLAKGGEIHYKNVPIMAFGTKGTIGKEHLTLKDMRVGRSIIMEINNKALPTTKIVKIFERII